MSSTVRAVVLEAAFPAWLEAAVGQGLVTGRAGVRRGHGEDVTAVTLELPLTLPCHWDTHSAPIPMAGAASRTTALRSSRCGDGAREGP